MEGRQRRDAGSHAGRTRLVRADNGDPATAAGGRIDPSFRLRRAVRFTRISGGLAPANITASMSRKADCFDNAPMESFFHTLKTELVHHRHYQTHAEAQRDIFAFIEASTIEPASIPPSDVLPRSRWS
jgi:transposase InsO family protein